MSCSHLCSIMLRHGIILFFWKAKNNNVLLHRTWKTLTLSCDSNGENFVSTLLPFTIFFLLLFYCSFFLIIYMDVKIHFIAYSLCLSWKYNIFFLFHVAVFVCFTSFELIPFDVLSFIPLCPLNFTFPRFSLSSSIFPCSKIL